MTQGKKLIEVTLPLDAINDASAYDKLPGVGPHPKGLHQWWARLPLPCARAVLFASIVDDPHTSARFANATAEAQEAETDRLMGMVRALCAKDATRNGELMDAVRHEVDNALAGDRPVVLDPFAGGGSIPLEALRLGLDVEARDLNPIPVLINTVLLRILPTQLTAGPVNSEARGNLTGVESTRANGLAEDLRHYAGLLERTALTQLSPLYPGASSEAKGQTIAWIWARVLPCPNPACQAPIPLVNSFALTQRKGLNWWVVPQLDRANKQLTFEVQSGTGSAPEPTKVGDATFRCLFCGDTATNEYIKGHGNTTGFQQQLLAVVVDGPRTRTYRSAEPADVTAARSVAPAWVPDEELAYDPRNVWCTLYGLKRHSDLYTPRQLAALTTLVDLLPSVRQIVIGDAQSAGVEGPEEYADAVITLLAFAIDRMADFNNAMCRWVPGNEKVMNLFARQAIPMSWDFAEANTFGSSVGSWKTCSDYIAKCIPVAAVSSQGQATILQRDAQSSVATSRRVLVSTDPPYYDNIAYADLSDFFYVWLRKSLARTYPDLLSTVLVPKKAELVATPYRFDGDRDRARNHFEAGFRDAFEHLRVGLDPRFPMTVYYAFKQGDDLKRNGIASQRRPSTGWETLLEALMASGFQITGTWPVRASQAWRMTSLGTNALASYIVLACRPRPASAPITTRKDFFAALRQELPSALTQLKRAAIAPVDLAQAAIGPGMAVFSRFAKVIDAEGDAMPVRAALALINQVLDEIVTEQEGELDVDTRWAVAWFEQYGFAAGPFGVAETLSKAKNTSIRGLVDAGIVEAPAGKVRLFGVGEVDTGSWDGAAPRRSSVWLLTHQLSKALASGGEQAGGELLRKVGGLADSARDLAYRLYLICERMKWAKEGLSYNSLVIAWPELVRLAAGTGEGRAVQQVMET